MTNFTQETQVGTLVAERPSRARVFERYGIDYCCGGKLSLAEACAKKNIRADELLGALRKADATSEPAQRDWNQAPLHQLLDHILATHHVYLHEELPRLARIVDKVARVHGENHPELLRVREIYVSMAGELNLHMQKEEHILFPLIRQLETATSAPRFHCGTVENPINVMLMEHDSTGEALAAIRKATKDYAPPPDACNTYRAMLDGLAQLERDTHQHIHLENNVLFPRAQALENA
ncbi:MAG: iron-sulfur cluster repair di-iron protein [Planctomycetes bacterium]|nr:iron-sulfur cluster repair di-iron protein [Planctomycetota bacterium]NUQ35887.1 iron-sulfur cluster repair di-iron protein [Planctomycetaceae bacterium]